MKTIPFAPGALPALGHSVSLLSNPLSWLASLPRYGDLVRIHFGSFTPVVVCAPDLIQAVLLDGRTFDRGGPLIERIQEIIGGTTLITCPHDRHLKHRRLTQPAFNRVRFPAYASTMITHIANMVDNWRDGQIIDLLAEMGNLTTTALMATMFADALQPDHLDQTIDDVSVLVQGLYLRGVVPPFWNRLPTPGNRRYFKACARLRHTASLIVASRRASSRDHGDLLSALLSARDHESPGRERLTNTEVIDLLVSFIIGGIETSAHNLVWAIYLVAMHPETERRLQEEVDEVLDGKPATFDAFNKLTWTRSIIKEALRLYPQGWIFTRMVTVGTSLGGYELSAGTTLLLSPYIIHRRSDLFPDPDQFNPGRWLQDPAPARQNYIPFGGGSRKCIGDEFSMLETTLTLATIATRWHLSPLAAHHYPRVALAASLRPRAMRMRAIRRELPPPHAPVHSAAAEVGLTHDEPKCPFGQGSAV